MLNGNTIQDSAKILGINRSTGTQWLKRFNEDGVEGLKPHYNERGRKCKLSEEVLKKIEKAILEEEVSYTIKDVQKFISKEFEIDYSYKQVWEITRIKLDLNYGKPFIKYKERPENYKENLKKKLKKFVEAFINQEIILAFMDQSYFQNAPNLVRTLHKKGMNNIFTKNRFKIWNKCYRNNGSKRFITYGSF